MSQPGKSTEHFLVIDGHVDLVYSLMRHHPGSRFEDLSTGQVTPGALAGGNVRIIISALYCDDRYNGPETASAHFSSLLDYARHYTTFLQAVTSQEALARCFHNGSERPGAVLLLENGDVLIDTGSEILHQNHIGLVGLTHAGRNRIGDGNGVSAPGGLTAEGKRLVRDLDRSGVIIDVAHLSEPCFNDLIETFAGVLVTTHTGFRRFCDQPRNLTDDQMRCIVERDGIIGVSVNPAMLSLEETADCMEAFRQIDWAVETFGPDRIALGTDFGGYDRDCTDLEDHGRLGNLQEQMERHGYDQETIKKILGENWYRLLNKHVFRG